MCSTLAAETSSKNTASVRSELRLGLRECTFFRVERTF